MSATDGRVISDLPAGLVLCGRYELQRKLADGAAASVYLAQDRQETRAVALKILDPLRGADPVGRARFEREFQILSSIQHEHVGRCHALEREDDLDILVLEFVDGQTLEDVLKNGRMAVPEAVRIASRLADALHACHQQGVLHRDLKPANIMLHPTRGPIILDFGVAWFSSAANLTRTGAVVGTPQYLAPEVFASSLVDARADVYALGVILFEMLTGRPVHLVQNVAELAMLHQTQDPPLVSALRPEIPVALANVVARAIAPHAEDRFSTAQELARALGTRALMTGKSLQSRLPCGACGAPLIIDLTFCPGCGVEVEWSLSEGPYAVQLASVTDIPRTMTWLTSRHRASLRSSTTAAQHRLAHTPVPLVVGASRVSAERLAAEAREAGCTAEIVRARAVIGARIRASAATITEVGSAALLHFGAVIVLGLIGIKVLHAEMGMLAPLPAAMGVLGIVAATLYVRRPLLHCGEGRQTGHQDRLTAQVRTVLATLKTDRARRLAASAVARAAPVLMREGGSSSEQRNAVRQHLSAALDAISQLDAHASLLMTRSRSRLANEMDALKGRAQQNDPDAVRRLAELERERLELVDASVAHDLAARSALEACQGITMAMAGAPQLEQ